jgi:hypothetical protein
MHIFIDESGSFGLPSPGNRNLSCVGALVIPEAKFNEVSERFATQKAKWGASNGEIKGSQMNEPQVAAVIEILINCGCLFFVVATEMSVNDEAAMRAYQKTQAGFFTDGLTDAAHPELRKQATSLRASFESMSSQIFIQTVLLTDLLKKVIDLATLHLAMTSPPEAGAFKWVIDGKDVTKTKYESAWELIAGGLIQSRCLESPGVMVEEGDYSHFERFLLRGRKWPAHLPPPNSRNPSKPGVILDLSKILYESLRFGDSQATPGLQLADIITNAFRRALMGRLQVVGYRRMGELMLRLNKSAYELHLFASATKAPSLDDYTEPHLIINSCSQRPGKVRR